MLPTRATLVLTTLVGLTAGIAGATIAVRWLSPPPAPSPALVVPTIDPVRRYPGFGPLPEAIRAAAAPAQPVATPPGVPVEEPGEGMPSLADQEEATLATFHALVDEHRAAPRDESWAHGAEQLFHADLDEAGVTGHFAVTAVDCRNTTCTAELEWPSYDEARAHFMIAAHSQRRANCGHNIFLPPPPDPSRPYRGTMLLECSEWKNTQLN